MTDLLDERTRHEVTERLGRVWAGRPVLLGPSVLAGVTRQVGWFRDLGCPVLVLTVARGVGPLPEEGTYAEVPLAVPATSSPTEELRLHDRALRTLDEATRARVEAVDPERQGTWFTTPFVSTDDPIEGRPVTGGRPRAWLDLEDKLRCEAVWDAAGVPRPASRVVTVEDTDALGRATRELRSELGAVWAGDARDGFNGGGDFVRWVVDDADERAARAFFGPRCDRVRVTPFLEGVPCSVHGFVLPDGTAALRPVEVATLRDPATRRLAHGGLGTTWDPPAEDREHMRDAVRRVGAHLQREHGYRGAFGIDGVLTRDGFRPTELNTRLTAGASTLSEVDRRFFAFLQAALVAGVDTGLTAADVEGTVPAMDADRVARVAAFGGAAAPPEEQSRHLAWDGATFTQGETDTGNELHVGPTPSGFFAKVQPCAAVETGTRLATVNAALLRYLDATYATDFGALEPAPDVRSAR